MNNGPVPSPMQIQRDNPRLDDPPVRETATRPAREMLRIIDDGRGRARTGSATHDPYNIDDIRAIYCPTNGDPKLGNIANEIDFNWKRYEVAGRPDFAEQRAYQDQGWRPVQHEAFPGRFAPEGTTGAVIIRDMILMERPMRLTVDARNDEIAEATRAMRVHRQTLGKTPDGHAPRAVFADRSSREAIEIPEE